MARVSNDGETPLGKRLVAIRKAFNYDDRKPFAVKLGISEGKLGRYEQGRSQPGADVLANIRDKLDIDLNWLATGEGKMLHSLNKLQDNSLIVPDTFSYIRKYEVNASAGDGLLVLSEEPVGQMAFDQAWLTEIGLDATQAGVIVASGDSMHPTIPNGTPMVVDFTNTEIIISGCIYVFNIGGELLVKRLERTIEDEITLISDNPIYERRTVDLNKIQDMKIIGSVRYILKDM